MVRVDGDPADERPRRPLGANQDADWISARKRDHAAAAPHLQVADRALERGRSLDRLVGMIRSPAAVQRIDEQPDVIGAAEAIGAHGSGRSTSNSQLPTPKKEPRE